MPFATNAGSKYPEVTFSCSAMISLSYWLPWCFRWRLPNHAQDLVAELRWDNGAAKDHLQEAPPGVGGRVCVLFMRPTYIVEGNLCYPKFTNLKVNLIQKHPPSWHKINPHIWDGCTELVLFPRNGRQLGKKDLMTCERTDFSSISAPLLAAD